MREVVKAARKIGERSGKPNYKTRIKIIKETLENPFVD
jgi:hypothetical protein